MSQKNKFRSLKAVSDLEDWFLKAHRKLPWRETTDPYAIWISEVMLQQTQVTTVIPYYYRFLETFPSIQALAASQEADVLKLWSGLGYYSRAKNLRKGAQAIRDRFEGRMPQAIEELLSIPGIGPYTAGAISSIAFNEAAPIVDGNVQRVFARFHGYRGELGRSETQTFFWKKANEWVKAARSPRVLNQALMELGALICLKGRARCESCPIQTACRAFKDDCQAELPVRKIRPSKIILWWSPLVLTWRGKYFLRKNQKGEWWTDLWDFPRLEGTSLNDVSERLEELLRKTPHIVHSRELSIHKHNVTHHHIHVVPQLIKLRRQETVITLSGNWFSDEQLLELPVSSLTKKILAQLKS